MNIFDWKQKSSWPKFLGSIEIIDGNVDEDLVWEFYNSFTHIRAYHATRSENPESYYTEGIRPANYRALEEHFCQLMKNNFGVEISQEHLDYAKEILGEFHNKSLFLALDDRELLETAGHYAIYGSEYIHALANYIYHKFGVGGSHLLKKVGTPTVFEVLVDIDLVTASDLREIICCINNYAYHREAGQNVDFTIELHSPILGNAVVSSYSPKQIKNPNQGFKYDYS